MKKDVLLYNGWIKIKKRFIDNKKYEVLIKKNAVGALIEDNENKFLLVKQFRPSILKYTLEIPAGLIDKKKLSKQEIMAEELLEEANLSINHKKLISLIKIIPEIGVSKNTIQLYYFKLKKKGENIETINDDSVVSAFWFSKEEIEKMILNGKINDSKTIIAFYFKNFYKYKYK